MTKIILMNEQFSNISLFFHFQKLQDAVSVLLFIHLFNCIYDFDEIIKLVKKTMHIKLIDNGNFSLLQKSAIDYEYVR